MDAPADALPAIIPGGFTPPLFFFFLALVSLLRSAFLCIKTPNLSQLVREEFVVIVPSSVSVVAVPGELRAPPPPRPALFREQRIFHRYCAGSILAISLTLGQDWIISNYLELGLKCPFLHRERADFPIYLFIFYFLYSRKIAFPLSPTEQRNVNTRFKQRGLRWAEPIPRAKALPLMGLHAAEINLAGSL